MAHIFNDYYKQKSTITSSNYSNNENRKISTSGTSLNGQQTQLPPQQQQQQQQPWEICYYCPMETFKISTDFIRHLRERHCTKEGGSYVCRYGFNGVCPSLPLDGVNDRDYETHVTKYHVNQITRQPEWSVFSAAQNLPAVLNDPLRGKQINLFTKKWGDSFIEKSIINQSPILLNITWTDFDIYMKKIGKRYRRHQRITTTTTPAAVAIQKDIVYENDNNKKFDQQHQQEDNSLIPAKTTTTSSSSSNTITHLYHQKTTNTNDLIGHLNDIPQIFFKSTFNLNIPTQFNEVFPGIDETTTTTTSSSTTTTTAGVTTSSTPQNQNDIQKQSGRLLQEKLSYYLDIVEIHIAKQVSEKSSAFFNAMTSQDTIMEQMYEATRNVKQLRDNLNHIDKTLIKDSLNILKLSYRRQNYIILLEKLRLMSTVHQTQPMIQLLLGTQDYVAALDLICTTQDIIEQELFGINCFRHLPMQLKEIEKLIDKMLITEFQRYITLNLNHSLIMNINNDEKNLQIDNLDINNDEDKLISIIMGLLREKNFNFIDIYKDEIIVTIKTIIKELLIDIISITDNEICLTGSCEDGQNLTIIEWIELLDKGTRILMKLLKQRIKFVYDIILRTTNVSAGQYMNNFLNTNLIESEQFLSDRDYKIVITKLNDLLINILNYCNERLANLISQQSLEKTIPTIDELLKLEMCIMNFTRNCYDMFNINCIQLKTALQYQSTRFVQKFHNDRKTKLSILLDSERWKQVDIPNEFQKIIDRISKNNFNIIINNMKLNNDNDNNSIISSNFNTNYSNKTNNNNNNNNGIKTSPVLLVDGKPYTLVGSVLILVQIITEYCRCSEQLPIINQQLARHCIDLLRTFNSRSCQLILGAGALQMAGLKTITTGNLVLVSRALQLILWLLPKIKQHFYNIDMKSSTSTSTSSTSSSSSDCNVIQTNSLINSFDIVEKDYQSHIKEIEDKVLSIVTKLIVTQLDLWDAKPPIPSQSFRNISRHLIKLHEAISSILPDIQIHSIYRVLHKNFKDKLRENLLKCNIINNGGPQHGVVTSELTFYMETLRTLKALPDIELNDNNLDDIWIK